MPRRADHRWAACWRCWAAASGATWSWPPVLLWILVALSACWRWPSRFARLRQSECFGCPESPGPH
eukprot:3444616-Alexandrium_andersonii.AAC.1